MAGDVITEYLAAEEYTRFVALVRRYSHDVLSRFNNLVIATEVCGKLLRNRPEQMLIIPIGAEEAAQQFDALRDASLAMTPLIRQFVWGDDPDNHESCEAVTRDWWYPYSAAKWDSFVFDYTRFVGRHMHDIESQVQAIEAWSMSGVLTPPDQSALLLNTMRQIRDSLEAVWDMLTASAAEERVAPVIADAAV